MEVCDTKPLDWALFVFTVITTDVTWWLLHIPTIWEEGWRRYLHNVVWECIRLHMPSVAAVIACWPDGKREHWQAFYYTGSRETLSTFRCIKGLTIDILTIITAILSLYHLCSDNPDIAHSFNSSLWGYPSLPGAVFGVWLWITSRTSMTRIQVALGGPLVVIVIGVSIALVMRYSLSDHSIWVVPTIIFAFMGLPWAFLDIARGTIFMVVFAMFGRIVGPAVGALNKDAYFPFCALKGVPFGATYLALGLLGGLLAGFGSCSYLIPVLGRKQNLPK